MAAQGLQGRPRRYPVTITIDHDGACYAIDDWVQTQETNGLPTDGQEFFDFLEEVGDRFPDAIVNESDDELPSLPADRNGPGPERPPEAGVPGKEFPDSVAPPSDGEEDNVPPRAAGPPESGSPQAHDMPADKPMCREPCLRRYDNHKGGVFVCPDLCALGAGHLGPHECASCFELSQDLLDAKPSLRGKGQKPLVTSVEEETLVYAVWIAWCQAVWGEEAAPE